MLIAISNNPFFLIMREAQNLRKLADVYGPFKTNYIDCILLNWLIVSIRIFLSSILPLLRLSVEAVAFPDHLGNF